MAIGVLEHGFLVDHSSFKNGGMLPPPLARWRGCCDFVAALCNKLIGSRVFNMSGVSYNSNEVFEVLWWRRWQCLWACAEGPGGCSGRWSRPAARIMRR